jgi:hypothetical protein
MLNEPRKVDYDFRVFLFEEWVWLYDESERTYACSTVPSIYAEPVYPCQPDDEGYDDVPDPMYFDTSMMEEHIPKGEQAEIEKYPFGEFGDREAWDEAREEACANHRL